METNHVFQRLTPAEPLAALLEQLEAVIAGLTDEQYVDRRAFSVSGSVGGHVRHLLDHVSALVDGGKSGKLNYDVRRRGTQVETRREAAVEEIRRLLNELCGLAALPSQTPVSLETALETDGASVGSVSTVGRELAFVISHTIHHCAVIALLLWQMGLTVPVRFGYAPSTPSAACDAA